MTEKDKEFPPRHSLNGAWKLDKSRGGKLRGYLETMDVPEMAIVAHEKGEADVDTINVIELNESTLRIKKTSRVNDLVEEFVIGKETKIVLHPGDREKLVTATSKNSKNFCIKTIMSTMNGVAEVYDDRQLVMLEDGVFMLQELVITNKTTGRSYLTNRVSFFRHEYLFGHSGLNSPKIGFLYQYYTPISGKDALS